jgi:hypothetical protein
VCAAARAGAGPGGSAGSITLASVGEPHDGHGDRAGGGAVDGWSRCQLREGKADIGGRGWTFVDVAEDLDVSARTTRAFDRVGLGDLLRNRADSDAIHEHRIA